MAAKESKAAELVWEGDSLKVAGTFPKDIRKELGEDIQRVQSGVKPKNGRPIRHRHVAPCWLRVLVPLGCSRNN